MESICEYWTTLYISEYPPPPLPRAKNELPIMSVAAYTSQTKKGDAGAEFLFCSINQSLFWSSLLFGQGGGMRGGLRVVWIPQRCFYRVMPDFKRSLSIIKSGPICFLQIQPIAVSPSLRLKSVFYKKRLPLVSTLPGVSRRQNCSWGKSGIKRKPRWRLFLRHGLVFEPTWLLLDCKNAVLTHRGPWSYWPTSWSI